MGGSRGGGGEGGDNGAGSLGKSQVAIGFLRITCMDPLKGPIAS